MSSRFAVLYPSKNVRVDTNIAEYCGYCNLAGFLGCMEKCFSAWWVYISKTRFQQSKGTFYGIMGSCLRIIKCTSALRMKPGFHTDVSRHRLRGTHKQFVDKWWLFFNVFNLVHPMCWKINDEYENAIDELAIVMQHVANGRKNRQRVAECARIFSWWILAFSNTTWNFRESLYTGNSMNTDDRISYTGTYIFWQKNEEKLLYINFI